jgi:ditrans,polycis-polyprenyl diphosphate synthase
LLGRALSDICSAILNICFPYTSRDEITSAIRSTVEDFSKPLHPQARPFSQTRITQKIRTQHLTTASSSSIRGTSPTPSNMSDADDSISSSTTLHPDSPPNDAREHQDSTVYPDPETITASTIGNHLFTAGDPPLDLLIRTSGVKRLSDFMLWQCHEDTEIVFLNCLWPEFDLRQFLPVLVEWQWRRKYVEERDRPFIRAGRANMIKIR